MPPPRDPEDGSITLWLLGLVVVVLFLGGISLDLWLAFTERRDLAATVDAAAASAASVIDEQAFRDGGVIALDPPGAAAAACAYLRRHLDPAEDCTGVATTATRVEVRAGRTVDLTLLRMLLPNEPPLRVEVTSRAEPHRVP